MFDDFFTRALLAGIGLSALVGPLGCLIIWRQMAFFGDTLAHAALLGIALAVMADLSPMIGVPVVTLATCVALLVAKMPSVCHLTQFLPYWPIQHWHLGWF